MNAFFSVCLGQVINNIRSRNIMANHLLKKVNIATRTAKESTKKEKGKATLDDLMKDGGYVRQASSLVRDAIEKGYDVLQLSNGDIVTSGTKVVVFRYTYNEEGQLVGEEIPVEEEETKVEALLPEEEKAFATV